MNILFHYTYGLAIFFFSYTVTKSILIYFKNKYIEKIIFFPISVLFVIFFILTFFLFLKIWIIIFFILIINIFKNYEILFKDIKEKFLFNIYLKGRFISPYIFLDKKYFKENYFSIFDKK